MLKSNLFRRNSKVICPLVVLIFAAIAWSVCPELTAAATTPNEHTTHIQAELQQRGLVDEAERILLSQGDWSTARQLLEAARNVSVKGPGGKKNSLRSKEADFYYAWMLCQTSSEKEKGRKILNMALKNYSWPPEKLTTIENLRGECGVNSSSKLVTVKENFVIAAIQKGGEWSIPVRLQSRNILPTTPLENFAESEAKFKAILGKSYNAIEVRPFQVVGPFPKSYLKKLADTVLTPYFNYLSNSLEIEYAGNPIFVFVAGNHTHFAEMTRRLYLVNNQDKYAPEMAIAFSDLPNNTMMAICGKDASNCTSFAHELFHLINSKVFEDAPWWLYEGTAELFESGDLNKGVFHPRAGWRKHDVMIDKLDSKTFRDLLNISKNDSTLNSPPGNKVAMSRARFFCRYLHEKKILWPIYKVLKNRDWQDNADDPAGIEVIEKTLNMALDDVNADFRLWFKQVVIPESSTPGP